MQAKQINNGTSGMTLAFDGFHLTSSGPVPELRTKKVVYAAPKSEDEKRAEREMVEEKADWEAAYTEQYEATMKFIDRARQQTMKVMQLKKEMEALKKENEALKESDRVKRKHLDAFKKIIEEQTKEIEGLMEENEALKNKD